MTKKPFLPSYQYWRKYRKKRKHCRPAVEAPARGNDHILVTRPLLLMIDCCLLAGGGAHCWPASFIRYCPRSLSALLSVNLLSFLVRSAQYSSWYVNLGSYSWRGNLGFWIYGGLRCLIIKLRWGLQFFLLGEMP